MIAYQAYRDADSVARAAADALHSSIRLTLKHKSICHIALPGGTTPAKCLQRLAELSLPWPQIHWYLGDERCLPKGDTQRNDVMIEDCLWSRIDAAAGNRHVIQAELGAEVAAEKYSRLINEIGKLDIVLLGMGEDGHTASLFPENDALDNRAAAVPVYRAPKPPQERVSLGLVTLQQATERHVIVTGKGKHDAMCMLQQGVDLPVARIGDAHWYVDEAAACQ